MNKAWIFLVISAIVLSATFTVNCSSVSVESWVRSKRGTTEGAKLICVDDQTCGWGTPNNPNNHNDLTYIKNICVCRESDSKCIKTDFSLSTNSYVYRCTRTDLSTPSTLPQL